MAERKDRMLSGYRVIYKPDHFNHSLNKKGYNGYVYEHRYVMECHLGRCLSHNEVVHHKDGNKLNNSLDNLELTDRANHIRKHNPNPDKGGVCVDCGKPISSRRNKRCKRCHEVSSRKVKRPPYDELIKMIEGSSYVAVGKAYGVSDNAIRKWVRFYEREMGE